MGMDESIQEQYDSRDFNEHERGDSGPTSPGVEKAPRGNPEADASDVRKGREKLESIVNW